MTGIRCKTMKLMMDDAKSMRIRERGLKIRILLGARWQ